MWSCRICHQLSVHQVFPTSLWECGHGIMSQKCGVWQHWVFYHGIPCLVLYVWVPLWGCDCIYSWSAHAPHARSCPRCPCLWALLLHAHGWCDYIAWPLHFVVGYLVSGAEISRVIPFELNQSWRLESKNSPPPSNCMILTLCPVNVLSSVISEIILSLVSLLFFRKYFHPAWLQSSMTASTYQYPTIDPLKGPWRSIWSWCSISSAQLWDFFGKGAWGCFPFVHPLHGPRSPLVDRSIPVMRLCLTICFSTSPLMCTRHLCQRSRDCVYFAAKVKLDWDVWGVA